MEINEGWTLEAYASCTGDGNWNLVFWVSDNEGYGTGLNYGTASDLSTLALTISANEGSASLQLLWKRRVVGAPEGGGDY